MRYHQRHKVLLGQGANFRYAANEDRQDVRHAPDEKFSLNLATDIQKCNLSAVAGVE